MIRPSDYHAIPQAVFEGMKRYVYEGCPTGSFLQAVIENDLTQAIGRADEGSMEALPAIVGWFYNEAPGNCWGSKKNREEWLEVWAKCREKQEAG